MASIKSIKQRIRSARNTAKITKAMELVSATKMRRSQQYALRARPYAAASLALLGNILARADTEKPPPHPLFSKRSVTSRALLVVTSDKGLAGAINSTVLKKADAWLAGHEDVPRTLITVGKKAKEYYERKGAPIVESFSGFGDYSEREETAAVADALLQGFLDGSWDEAAAVYTNFRTSLVQECVARPVLPATEEGLAEAVAGILPEHGRYASPDFRLPTSDFRHGVQQSTDSYRYEYVIEPSQDAVLSSVVPQLLRLHIHHIILEANASEHSARMVAMKNASDSAGELITDFTRLYNQARQANITREIAEISAGAEALTE